MTRPAAITGAGFWGEKTFVFMIDLNELKKLAIAYRAALEFDICPDEDESVKVQKLFYPKLPMGGIDDALSEHQGSRPYEIADKMVDLIDSINP